MGAVLLAAFGVIALSALALFVTRQSNIKSHGAQSGQQRKRDIFIRHNKLQIMDIKQLVGNKVRILENDLFEKSNVAIIRAIDVDNKSLLLEVSFQKQVDQQTPVFVVAQVRYCNNDLSNLIAGNVLHCNLTCIPRDRYNLEKPFDLSWWRGGDTIIAGVILI